MTPSQKPALDADRAANALKAAHQATWGMDAVTGIVLATLAADDAWRAEHGAAEVTDDEVAQARDVWRHTAGAGSFEDGWKAALADFARRRGLPAQRAVERVTQLEDALRLILPMAKGYAAAHRVGNNDQHIQSAEAALSVPAQTAPPPVAPAETSDIAGLMDRAVESLATPGESASQPLRNMLRALAAERRRNVERDAVVGRTARARKAFIDKDDMAFSSAIAERFAP